MIISKLIIHTFGGISNRETRFAPGLNLIVGANETGKSTMFRALQHLLLTPANLGKRVFQNTIEPFLPVGGGDTVSAEVRFSSSGEQCTLRKSWGATSEAVLYLQDGSSLTDEDRIRARLQNLLPAEEGALSAVFMTYQSGLPRTLQDLQSDPETVRSFSDILRRAVMEMDGVSVTALTDELDSCCSAFLKNWDIDRNRPGKSGSGQPYKTGGELLKSFNELEELRGRYRAIQRAEEELAEIDRHMAELRSKISAHERFLQDGRQPYTDLQEKQTVRLRLERLGEKEQKLKEDYDLWPKVEEKLKSAGGLLPEMQAEVAALDKEKDAAKRVRDNAETAAQFERAEKKRELLQQKQKHLEQVKELPRAELAVMGELDERLKQLEAGLAAAQMVLKVHAKKEVSFTLKQGLSEPARRSVSPGETGEFSGEGFLQLQYDDFDLEIRSSIGDYDSAAREHAGCKKKLSELLQKHGVASCREAEAACTAYEAALRDVRQAQADFTEELNGQDYEKLKQRAEQAAGSPDARPFEEVVLLLSEKRKALDDTLRSKEQAAQELERLEQKYSTRDGLFKSMLGTSREKDEMEKRLHELAGLPEGFTDEAAFKQAYEQTDRQLEEHERELNELRVQRAAGEAALGEESAEEMLVMVREAEERFEKLAARARALRKVRDTAGRLLERFDQSTYTGYEHVFNTYAARLTAGRYSRSSMNEPLPDGFVRSDGAVLPYQLLSAGTRDVFSLALRLTMAEIYLNGSEGFLVMDDPLVDLDPERQKLAAELLTEFAHKAQLIVFTCHPSHSALFDDAQITDLNAADQ
jgi:exonuclease SbcC